VQELQSVFETNQSVYSIYQLANLNEFSNINTFFVAQNSSQD